MENAERRTFISSSAVCFPLSSPEDALDEDEDSGLLITLAGGNAPRAPFALVPLVDRTELVELDRAFLPFVARGVTFGANDVLRAAAAAVVVEAGASRAVEVDVDAEDDDGGRATDLFGLAVAIDEEVRDAILGLGLGPGALIDGLGARLALGAAGVVPAGFAPVVNLADTGVILGAEVPVAFTVDTLLIDEEACRAGVRVDAENMD